MSGGVWRSWNRMISSNEPFDYLGHAEAVRKASKDFERFTADSKQRLREVAFNPDLQLRQAALREWHELQNSVEYERLLAIFWNAIESACPPYFDEHFEKLKAHID